MTDRLVVLDKSRKAILTLPPAALKLWLTYWMNEDEENESYLSHAEMKAQGGLGMSQPTITGWTAYLVRHGWLIDTGKTAYDKFLARGIMATANSKQVRVYKVDDPTPKESLVVTPKIIYGVHPQNNFGQGSSSGSGVGSGSSSASNTVAGSCTETDSSSASSAFGGSPRPEVQNENQNPNPEPKPTPTKVKRAKDGTPWPKDFDSWSVPDKLAWSDQHNKVNGVTPHAKPEEQPQDRCRNGCSASLEMGGDSGLCIICYEDSLNPATL